MKSVGYHMLCILVAVVVALAGCSTPSENHLSDREISRLVSDLNGEESDKTVVAIYKLIREGPSVLPMLIDGGAGSLHLFGDDIIRGLGPSAVDPLMRLLESARSAERKELIVSAMGIVGPPCSPAVEMIIEEINTAPPDLRIAICRALGSIMPQGDLAIDALVGMLEDPAATVAGEAAIALGRIATPGDQEAIDAILAITNQGSPDSLTPELAFALHQLGWSRHDMFDFISSKGRDHQARGHLGAVRALAELANCESLRILGDLVRDPVYPTRTCVIYQLELCGPQPEVLHILVEAVQSEDNDLQFAALLKLSSFGPSARPVLPELYALRRGSENEIIDADTADFLDRAIILISQNIKGSMDQH